MSESGAALELLHDSKGERSSVPRRVERKRARSSCSGAPRALTRPQAQLVPANNAPLPFCPIHREKQERENETGRAGGRKGAMGKSETRDGTIRKM